METEKQIESKLVQSVKIKNGIAVKFYSPFFTGMPDRMVMLPGGRLVFVELKAPRGRLAERQKVVGQLLSKMGFEVRVITTMGQLDNFLEQL